MSSTQLIEQCVTRLRGIVEALDNIHDTSPQRWSTDLDDVHSSAESLLALINDQAPTLDSQGLALRTIAEYPCPEQDNMTATNMRQVAADAITGALAFGAQASQPPAEDHWLRPFYDIGRAEGQRTQELAMLVRMLASALKRHAPDSNLVARATNYLAAKGLAGTPLRDSSASVEQAGGDERKLSDLGNELHNLSCSIVHENEEWAEQIGGIARELWNWPQARATLAQPEGAPVIGCLCGMPMTEGQHSPAGCSSLEEFATHSAQAQHSVPEGWMLVECGIWTQEQVDEMQKTVARFRSSEFVDDRALAMAVADAGQCKAPEISLAELLAAAPGKEVPQAWLDVQAERKRQVEVEGWTPEHDDKHNGGELADAAACYALWAGGINPGNWREFWPWAPEWLKHSEPRRMLVKAGALILAEIERLDRVAASQGGPSDA
ncbi:hypothetical protein ACPTKM_04120 [Pseudomonas aeruginosa]|uniref:hypothetical protein n=1 Tax=Pseudomonas aeruginosa TaxID=287 RepID=UPI003CC58725